MKEWWSSPKFFIAEIDNQDYGITTLAGRYVGGDWEYAIIFWRYKVPELVSLFKNGSIILGTKDGTK